MISLLSDTFDLRDCGAIRLGSGKRCAESAFSMKARSLVALPRAQSGVYTGSSRNSEPNLSAVIFRLKAMMRVYISDFGARQVDPYSIQSATMKSNPQTYTMSSRNNSKIPVASAPYVPSMGQVYLGDHVTEMKPPRDAQVAYSHWGAYGQTVVRPSEGFTIQALYPPRTAKIEGVTAVYSIDPGDPYVLEHHLDLAASQVTFANAKKGTRLAFSVGRDDTRDTAFVTFVSPSVAMQVGLPRGKHQVRLVLDDTKTGKDSIKAEKRLREGEDKWTVYPNCDYYDIEGTEVTEVNTRKSTKSAR